MIHATNAPIVSIEVGGSGSQTVRFDGGEPRFTDGIDVMGGARVGIAVPGGIDPETKRVVAASTLGWVDVDPAVALGLPFEPEVVCNDAAAAALGEWALRGGRDDRLIYIGLGTGIGGAVVARGAIERENLFGHQRGFSDRACLCGGIGCLETVAAGWALPDPLDRIAARRVAFAVARTLREEAAASRGVIVVAGGIPIRHPDLVPAIARDLPGRTVVSTSAPTAAKSAAAWGIRHLVAPHRFGVA